MQSPGRFFEHFGRSKMRRNQVVEGLRPPMATGGPILEFDLPAAVMQLKQESNWSGHRNARTLVKHRDCRIVLMDLERGAHLVRHQTRGTVVIQVVSGRIKVHVFNEVFDVPSGHIISLDPHLSHDVEALEETALLIRLPGRKTPNRASWKGSVHKRVRKPFIPSAPVRIEWPAILRRKGILRDSHPLGHPAYGRDSPRQLPRGITALGGATGRCGMPLPYCRPARDHDAPGPGRVTEANVGNRNPPVVPGNRSEAFNPVSSIPSWISCRACVGFELSYACGRIAPYGAVQRKGISAG